MKAVFQFITILLLVSCNPKSAEKIQGESNANDRNETIDATIQDTFFNAIATEEPDNESFPTILEFEKTTCFGKCPSFKVQIFSNGKVIYQGKANVEKTGFFESKVNDSFMFFIFQEAEKIGFFQFSNTYPVDGKEIPDLPKTITYLNDGSNELKVVDAFDAPLSLRNFEKFLIDKIDSLYWEKVKD